MKKGRPSSYPDCPGRWTKHSHEQRREHKPSEAAAAVATAVEEGGRGRRRRRRKRRKRRREGACWESGASIGHYKHLHVPVYHVFVYICGNMLDMDVKEVGVSIYDHLDQDDVQQFQHRANNILGCLGSLSNRMLNSACPASKLVMKRKCDEQKHYQFPKCCPLVPIKAKLSKLVREKLLATYLGCRTAHASSRKLPPKP